MQKKHLTGFNIHSCLRKYLSAKKKWNIFQSDRVSTKIPQLIYIMMKY